MGYLHLVYNVLEQ